MSDMTPRERAEAIDKQFGAWLLSSLTAPPDYSLVGAIEAAIAAAVAQERARAVRVVNHARHSGESDLRSVRSMIESGEEPEARQDTP